MNLADQTMHCTKPDCVCVGVSQVEPKFLWSTTETLLQKYKWWWPKNHISAGHKILSAVPWFSSKKSHHYPVYQTEVSYRTSCADPAAQIFRNTGAKQSHNRTFSPELHKSVAQTLCMKLETMFYYTTYSLNIITVFSVYLGMLIEVCDMAAIV